ncbi:potassium voltage-gated channel protein Shaw-like [Mercenaria mercenaria]|uniref:potassium voltage-gated channel protein Shaw-like n=1 Tax=Mercenaria mercenaria TaxID=6596 RepID=UPI00234F922E|nr:potassium voltage-gated channel protein Shaw-like [Mercenaria mercenaria]
MSECRMVHKLKFNVGGQIYSISTNSLQNGPESKLTRMYQSGTTLTESAYIDLDRPRDVFASVLALYQTGELHFPMTSCPGAFLNELEFWEISPEMVESCCFNRLQSFVDEQETLQKFRESREASRKHFCYSNQFMKSFQCKLWNIIDYSKPSAFGRLYFMVSLFMVLLSICTLAFSTDPYFRRQMSNCERLEYMESSGMEKIELARKWLKEDCNSDKLPDHRPPVWMTPPHLGDTNECNPKFQTSVNIFLRYRKDSDKNGDSESVDDEDNDENRSHGENINDQPTGTQEQGNCSDDTPVSTPSEISNGSQMPGMMGEYVELPDFDVQIYAFTVLEAVTVVYFTIDIILRLLFCPSRKWYFLSIINFADMLALIGSYIHFVLMQVYTHEKYRDSWMDSLRYVQVLRSMRLFHIVSNVRAGQVLAYTVRENFKDLSILILFLIVGMSSFASCMFVAEAREDFQSIPVGWYWALVTMTTVGYGDIAPKTAVGRVMACLCAFSGIILLALTVPIFANNFLTLYRFANSEKAVQKFQQKRSKVKTSQNGVKILGNNTFYSGED